jgi:hypothetical protein
LQGEQEMPVGFDPNDTTFVIAVCFNAEGKPHPTGAELIKKVSLSSAQGAKRFLFLLTEYSNPLVMKAAKSSEQVIDAWLAENKSYIDGLESQGVEARVCKFSEWRRTEGYEPIERLFKDVCAKRRTTMERLINGDAASFIERQGMSAKSDEYPKALERSKAHIEKEAVDQLFLMVRPKTIPARGRFFLDLDGKLCQCVSPVLEAAKDASKQEPGYQLTNYKRLRRGIEIRPTTDARTTDEVRDRNMHALTVLSKLPNDSIRVSSTAASASSFHQRNGSKDAPMPGAGIAVRASGDKSPISPTARNKSSASAVVPDPTPEDIANAGLAAFDLSQQLMAKRGMERAQATDTAIEFATKVAFQWKAHRSSPPRTPSPSKTPPGSSPPQDGVLSPLSIPASVQAAAATGSPTHDSSRSLPGTNGEKMAALVATAAVAAETGAGKSPTPLVKGLDSAATTDSDPVRRNSDFSAQQQSAVVPAVVSDHAGVSTARTSALSAAANNNTPPLANGTTSVPSTVVARTAHPR